MCVLSLSEGAKTCPFPKRNFACHIIHDSDSDLQSGFDASCASPAPGTIKFAQAPRRTGCYRYRSKLGASVLGKMECLERIWTIDVDVQSKASKRDQIRNGKFSEATIGTNAGILTRPAALPIVAISANCNCQNPDHKIRRDKTCSR